MQVSPFLNSDITALAQYTIKDTIGTGSFGVVKYAIHNKTNVKVAIKILDKSTIPCKNKRMYNEISVLQSLNHINICKVYEVIETPRTFYIVTEYISEGELFSYTQERTRLLQNDISKFFYQIINAVEYWHANNITHRDLKLENIWIDSNNVIKIIDFGLAKKIDEGNNWLSTICGSLLYSPPEMWKEEKYDGMLADIWSLGVILYVMSAGQLPFEDTNENELIRKIINNKVCFPHFIPFAIKELIKNLLVKTPKDRWSWSKIKDHSIYKHGKILFFRENIIYEEDKINKDNIHLKYQIQDKASKWTEEKLNDIKEKSTREKPCNWRIVQKILQDNIIKTHDWRKYWSCEKYCFSNSNEYDDILHNMKTHQKGNLTCEDLSKLTPSDIIKRIRRMNMWNSFTESYRSANRPNSVIKNKKQKENKANVTVLNYKESLHQTRAISEFKGPRHISWKSFTNNASNVNIMKEGIKEPNINLMLNIKHSDKNSPKYPDISLKTYSLHYIKKITSPTPIHKVINWNNNSTTRSNYSNNSGIQSNSVSNQWPNLFNSSRISQANQKIKTISLTKDKGKLPFPKVNYFRFHTIGISNLDDMTLSTLHNKNNSFSNFNKLENSILATNSNSKTKKRIGYIKLKSMKYFDKNTQQASRNYSKKAFNNSNSNTLHNGTHKNEQLNERKLNGKRPPRTHRFQSSNKWSTININFSLNEISHTNRLNNNKEISRKRTFNDKALSKTKEDKLNGKTKQLTIYLNSNWNVERVVKQIKSPKKEDEKKKRLSLRKAVDNVIVTRVNIEWNKNEGKVKLYKTKKETKKKK